METHAHHLHKTPGAGWRHYVFEFLMLFLAVFCGFLAENWREHIVDRRRERELMGAFVNDLKLDTSQLSGLTYWRKRRAQELDSTIQFYSEQQFPRVPVQAFRLSTWLFRLSFFYQNTGTLDQLKNAGGFRLVRQRQIIDSIESYDRLIKRMEKRDALEGELAVRQRQLVERLFDGKALAKIYADSILFSGRESAFTTKSSQTIDLNTQYLDEYLTLLIDYRELLIVDSSVVVDLKNIAKNLISLIKKEYHLDG